MNLGIAFHPIVAAAGVTELLHILATGQSNMIGGGATPIFTTGPISGGLMFNGGMKPGSAPENLASLIPLEESVFVPFGGETGVSALVNWLRDNVSGNRLFLISNVGVGGAPYADIKKGTQPYADHIAQISAAKAIADANGMSYRVLCAMAIHGEADEGFSTPDYGSDVQEWQDDYEIDAKEITGQSESIPMFFCAQAATAPFSHNAANLNNSSSIALLRAHLAAPTKVIFVSPETFLDFYSGPHFTAFSHAWLGVRFAQAIKTVCFDAGSVSPIYPTGAAIVGDTIVIDFHVPVPPIRLEYRFGAHTDSAGFLFKSSDGILIPTSVQVTGPSQLTLFFDETPGGTGRQVCFATGNVPGALYLPKVELGSNVADSRDLAGDSGPYGLPMCNFLSACYLDL